MLESAKSCSHHLTRFVPHAFINNKKKSQILQKPHLMDNSVQEKHISFVFSPPSNYFFLFPPLSFSLFIPSIFTLLCPLNFLSELFCPIRYYKKRKRFPYPQYPYICQYECQYIMNGNALQIKKQTKGAFLCTSPRWKNCKPH